MMTQVRKKRAARSPATPAQARRCCDPVDDLLDPALFKALSDPTRVLLLGCLIKCARPCTVTEVAECCEVDFSVVSRHLRLLEGAGILTATRAGRSVAYAVRADHVCDSLRALADAIDHWAHAGGRGGCCG